MRIRRGRASLFLFLCGATLLVAIAVGERMGERVLHQVTGPPIVPALATPRTLPSLEVGGLVRNWRRVQVISVATDPGFPDPRVTPPPSPTPRPTKTPTPVPTPTPFVPPTPEPTPSPQGSESATPAATATPDTTRPPR
ncbi:MAG: hypothetical protein JOY59_06930 [Candidatus Eremiobacteraeota bacterium]|nr:hypothetical protein [Candidatus Eremiobacteraeota bacterium]